MLQTQTQTDQFVSTVNAHVLCDKVIHPTSPLPPDGEDWELLWELDGGSPYH